MLIKPSYSYSMRGSSPEIQEGGLTDTSLFVIQVVELRPVGTKKSTVENKIYAVRSNTIVPVPEIIRGSSDQDQNLAIIRKHINSKLGIVSLM